MRFHDFYTIFFFNDTATTEIYTLSLHDALPISGGWRGGGQDPARTRLGDRIRQIVGVEDKHHRSEEHTSELQSQSNYVCRLLLLKKKCADRDRTIRISHLLRAWHDGQRCAIRIA